MRYVRLFNTYEEASADETLVTPNVTLILDSSSLLSYDSGYSDEPLMIRRDKDGKLIIGPGPRAFVLGSGILGRDKLEE